MSQIKYWDCRNILFVEQNLLNGLIFARSTFWWDRSSYYGVFLMGLFLLSIYCSLVFISHFRRSLLIGHLMGLLLVGLLILLILIGFISGPLKWRCNLLNCLLSFLLEKHFFLMFLVWIYHFFGAFFIGKKSLRGSVLVEILFKNSAQE